MAQDPFVQRNVPEPCNYDYALGIDPYMINYIRESHVVQSRVSPMRCYLLQRLTTPDEQEGSIDSPVIINSYIETAPRYRAVIWDNNGVHPDIRSYTNEGQGGVRVYISGVEAKRVEEVSDLTFDNEFTVVERKDLPSRRVEIVFNEGFIATNFAISYWYTELSQGVTSEAVKRGPSNDDSLFGWQQFYDNTYDDFRGVHQILVRFPITNRDVMVGEEGRVQVKENQAWMIWHPYVRDFDILVVPQQFSETGKEERYEIVDKQDSIIQHQLVSQRFKLKLLEYSDDRYKIPYITDKVI